MIKNDSNNWGICGEKVVIIADRMNMMEEETHEQHTPNIYYLDKSICIGFAGTSGYEKELIEVSGNVPTLSELFELMKEKILGRYGVESVNEFKLLIEDRR